ncbi:type IV toxin-antitoxin system AbiEi family antitoxin domain-containing protein [Geodermatophilus sp. SYSU D00815]
MEPLLTRAMRQHRGVFATSDAFAAGIDRNAIGPLLRSGQWRRLRHGVYTTADVWRRHEAEGSTHRLECAAVLRRLDGERVVVSHTSAARLHQFVVPRSADAEVHLTDPARFRAGKGYRVSQASLLVEDVVDLDGLPVTAVGRTLADVGREWQLTDTVVAADDALADGRLTIGQLEAAALAQTHWVNCGRAARAFSLARVGAHSPLETWTRLAIVAAGLPEPLLQQAVFVAGRLIAVLDMLWPDHGVFVECDGQVKYTDPWRDRTPSQVLWEEKKRQDDLLDLDLRGVRIASDDLWQRRDQKLGRLRDLLNSRRTTIPRYQTESWRGGVRAHPRTQAS